MGAKEVGLLAQDLAAGLTAQVAIRDLLDHPATELLFQEFQRRNRGPAIVPVGYIFRRDGSSHSFDALHYLRKVRNDEAVAHLAARQWIMAALLTLGDALADEGYFDRAPDLEFVRHLRNGIAHGNRFNLAAGEPRRPARFRSANGDLFEVTPQCHDQPVLFEFIEQGDVADLLMHVSWRLMRIGNGDPPLDLFPQ